MLEISDPVYPLLPTFALERREEPRYPQTARCGFWQIKDGSVFRSLPVEGFGYAAGRNFRYSLGTNLPWCLAILAAGCLEESDQRLGGSGSLTLRKVADHLFAQVAEEHPGTAPPPALGLPVRQVWTIPVEQGRIEVVEHGGYSFFGQKEGELCDANFMVRFEYAQVTGLLEGEARRLALLWRAVLLRRLAKTRKDEELSL